MGPLLPPQPLSTPIKSIPPSVKIENLSIDRLTKAPPITSATNDLKMLRLEYSFGNIIPNGGGIYMENFVPLIWAPISFDFVYPAFPRDNACFTFRCSAPSGEIQISKMSLREVR